MINPRAQRVGKIMELLEEVQLFSDEEIEIIEEYMTGEEADEEELSRISLRDFSAVSSSLSYRFNHMFQELISKGKMEEAERLGKVLFQAGRTSGFEMYPLQHYIGEAETGEAPSAGRTAVYAAKYASNEWQVTRFSMENLKKMAGNDTGVIKKALEYQHETPAGELFLLAVYFLVKYPDVKTPAAEGEERKDGILAGLAKMFAPQDGGSGRAINAEDTQWMEQYEDIIINSMPNLFSKGMNRQTLDRIAEALRADTLDGEILALAKANGPGNRYLLRLLGGTAFANAALSPCLRNMVSLCLAVGGDGMLDAMNQMDARGELKDRGGCFDQIYGVEAKKLIKWAAEKKNGLILTEQFRRNKDCFLECMDKADFEVYGLMASVVKELDAPLYEQRKQRDLSRQQAKVIQEFVNIVDTPVQGQVRSYLKGEAEIETLYQCGSGLEAQNSRWGGRHWSVLQNYEKGYGLDSITSRCLALLMLSRTFTSYSYLTCGGEISPRKIKDIFEAVDREKLAVRNQLDGYGDMWDSFYRDEWKRVFNEASREVFRKYLEERREETIDAFRNAGSTGRSFGLSILGEKPEEYKEVILGFAQDTSKAVREELLRILYERKDWEEEIRNLLASRKAADRETAVCVLTRWDSVKYAPVFAEALEKEKNGKVRTLLESALKVEYTEKTGGNAASPEDLVKELHRGGRKRSLAWAYETPFSCVHRRDGREAGEDYLQAILLAYASMSPCGVSQAAAALAGDLEERELAVYVNELFDKWMEAGAESKKRWVLYAASIHGGGDIIVKLQHQIQEWPQAARGAIASEAVQALALNPLPQALLIVDGISRKFKFKQVKAAAGKALEFAASQLGITTEELADRIVPSLGFDENMERIFDYGERKFTVTITTALEIQVFDESGKKLKNLPAPGKRDDEEKAGAAYEEFKQMKKQMKATVSSQKMRLEMALSTGREWSAEAWKNLFVKNPVMHQFAIGLIWGIYEDHKLIQCFRYMEDGSFNTKDEEEFLLPEDGDVLIGLVHPIELSPESLDTWKEQLQDYEIVQPIEQLDRPIYYRTEEEENQKSLERFGGCIINDLSMGGKLTAMGWYRGSVQDGGGFYSYYREDREVSMGVELHFSGSFVGGENQDVTVYEVWFYRTGDADGNVVIKRGSYVYDEANDSNSCFLREVPQRYFSEIVLQLTRALAASKEKNENWKKNR